MASTTTSKSTLEHSGVSFLRFWVTFSGDRFSIDFRSIKSHPKINKTAGEDDQEDPCTKGSAAEAVPGEALESEDF